MCDINKNEVFININYYNEPIKGQIIVNTKKEIFTINNNNYNIESTIRPSINIELSKDNEVVNTYKTDNNGYLLIDNLELTSDYYDGKVGIDSGVEVKLWALLLIWIWP